MRLSKHAPDAPRLSALAVLVFVFALAGCSQDSSGVEWILVWEDDFEGPAGQSPDPEKWNFDIGTDWGNNQLEYDTDDPANVSLDGQGNLAIVAREEEFLGSRYTSGRITTRDLFEQTRGRFEARIKLPVGQGIWPAFWLLGSSIETVGWPACGEIDIMEYLGHEPRKIHGSIHGPGYSGGNSVTGSYVLNDPGGFPFAFHVFGIEWSNERIVWTVNGERYLSIDTGDVPTPADWVFNRSPFFLILNLAVGGNWPGPPDETTEFPQTMLVDYVRVYRGSQ